MRSRPTIFLDIDGVLCTARSCVLQSGLMQILDPCGVGMLRKLVEEFDAHLVLSSTWRVHHDRTSMTAILQNAGLHDVPWHTCWRTPELRNASRGTEISAWMETNGTPDRFLIIDDDVDMMPSQLDSFVRTHTHDGFMWSHYQQARKILGAKK